MAPFHSEPHFPRAQRYPRAGISETPHQSNHHKGTTNMKALVTSIESGRDGLENSMYIVESCRNTTVTWYEYKSIPHSTFRLLNGNWTTLSGLRVHPDFEKVLEKAYQTRMSFLSTVKEAINHVPA